MLQLVHLIERAIYLVHRLVDLVSKVSFGRSSSVFYVPQILLQHVNLSLRRLNLGL